MLNTTKPRQPLSSQIIWDAIMELHNLQQPITRDVLAEATGLRLTVIDDHVGRMVDDGKLRRLVPGVFTPVIMMSPPRSISKTVLTDGGVMIEIGDQVLHLTPQEDRALAALQAGTAIQFSAIHAGQEINALAAGFREALNVIKYGPPQKDGASSASSVAPRKKRANHVNDLPACALDAIKFGAPMDQDQNATTTTGDASDTVVLPQKGEIPPAPVVGNMEILNSSQTSAHEPQQL